MKNLTVLMAAILVLIGCSSQPRFTFIGNKDQAIHRYEMFDNKTGKACWAGPVELNDGKQDLERAIQKYNETHPNQPYSDAKSTNPFDNLSRSQAEPGAAQERVQYLQDHPKEQRVQVNGLPYCEDLK